MKHFDTFLEFLLSLEGDKLVLFEDEEKANALENALIHSANNTACTYAAINPNNVTELHSTCEERISLDNFDHIILFSESSELTIHFVETNDFDAGASFFIIGTFVTLSEIEDFFWEDTLHEFDIGLGCLLEAHCTIAPEKHITPLTFPPIVE